MTNDSAGVSALEPTATPKTWSTKWPTGPRRRGQRLAERYGLNRRFVVCQVSKTRQCGSAAGVDASDNCERTE